MLVVIPVKLVKSQLYFVIVGLHEILHDILLLILIEQAIAESESW